MYMHGYIIYLKMSINLTRKIGKGIFGEEGREREREKSSSQFV